MDQAKKLPQVEKPPPPPASNENKDELSLEEKKIMARYTHHCELNSKEKMVEELRSANPTLFTSRAKTIRNLNNMAEKKRHPRGIGVFWEVKKSVLEELQLFDVFVSTTDVSKGGTVCAQDL